MLLMQSRVGAEVSIAAGLEQVCVGKNGQDTIDLLVNYALDPVLQKREYLAENKKGKRGIFCTQRVPCGWMATLEFYRDQERSLAEGEKLPDFKIPFEENAAFPFEIDATCSIITDPVRAILGHMMEALRGAE